MAFYGKPSKGWRCYLEGNIFVGNFGTASRSGTAAVRIVSRCSVRLKVVATTGAHATAARCSAFGAASQHAEVVGDNFKAGTLLAFLVLPFARLDASFDENQRAFLEVLLCDFGLLAPYDNLVPLGTLLTLAIFVFVRFVRGDGEICDGLAAAGIARFGIAAQTAYENDFVDRHGTPPKTAKIACERRKGK